MYSRWVLTYEVVYNNTYTICEIFHSHINFFMTVHMTDKYNFSNAVYIFWINIDFIEKF